MAPTVTVISDLHLEARPLGLDAIVDGDLHSDVLCLLGDIGDPASQAYRDLIAAAAARFPTVLVLAGNNEYRNHGGGGRTMEQTEQLIREAAAPFPNVRFLQNETHIVGDVAFIGTTLWSYLPDEPLPRQEEDAGQRLEAGVSVAQRQLVPAVPASMDAAQAVSDKSPFIHGVTPMKVARPGPEATAADVPASRTASAGVEMAVIERHKQQSEDLGPARGHQQLPGYNGEPSLEPQQDAVVTVRCISAGMPPSPSSGTSVSAPRADDVGGRGGGLPSNRSAVHAHDSLGSAAAVSSGSRAPAAGILCSPPASAAIPVQQSSTAAPRQEYPGKPPQSRFAARSQPMTSPLHLLRWRTAASYGQAACGEGCTASGEGDASAGDSGGDAGISGCRRLLLRHSISLSSLRPDDPIPNWRAHLSRLYFRGDTSSSSRSGSSSSSERSGDGESSSGGESVSGSSSGEESGSESDARSRSGGESDEGDSEMVSGSATTDSITLRRGSRRLGSHAQAPTSDVSEASGYNIPPSGPGQAVAAQEPGAPLLTSSPRAGLPPIPADSATQCTGSVLPGGPAAAREDNQQVSEARVGPASPPVMHPAPSEASAATIDSPQSSSPRSSHPGPSTTSSCAGLPLGAVDNGAIAASAVAPIASTVCHITAASGEQPLQVGTQAPAAADSVQPRASRHSHHGHHHGHHHSRHASQSSASAVPTSNSPAHHQAPAPLPPATVREYIGATSLDYRRIFATAGGPPITTDFTNALFVASLEYVQAATAVARTRGLTPVVLSHHAPSMNGTCRPKFAGHPSTHAYGTDLEPFLESSGIAVWYCGHTHYNFDVVLKGGVRLASNQFGSQAQPADGFSRTWQQTLAGPRPLAP